MASKAKLTEVGGLRPSQLLFSYGVGSIVDLPYISAMVLGLEDWDTAYTREIGETRLLEAVKNEIGPQITRLLAPPANDNEDTPSYQDSKNLVGVPVAAFPRWMLCPRCRFLAPVERGLFKLKVDQYRPDRARYVHENCVRAFGNTNPAVVPARFLVACENGHMDDFPWDYFVHRGQPGCKSSLRLQELSPSGEAATIQVECKECGARRRMSEAFGKEGQNNLPICAGRRPHLRDYEAKECGLPSRAISLGASNIWFPIILSALAVPVSNTSKLVQLVEDYWHKLEKAVVKEVITAFKGIGELPKLAEFSDNEIWDAVVTRRATGQPLSQPELTNLKLPEWKILNNPDSVQPTRDFQVTVVKAPMGYENLIKQVVLVERLREVQALIGFTRIESPSNYTNVDEIPSDYRVKLTRQAPTWVPAAEVRGEGIFIQFREEALNQWLEREAVQAYEPIFRKAYRKWRLRRNLNPPEQGFPGMRYVLLHSFSHALMRQLALECGYSAASIRERIYSLEPTEQDGPMAGILLYTAASDSEGTLGGLVGLGYPEELTRHIDEALEQLERCSSDPLCAEHVDDMDATLHGAACHACLFVPETSCERGNKYLDRSVLVKTVHKTNVAFDMQ